MANASIGQRGSKGFAAFIVLLMFCGLVSRLAPLGNQQGRLLRQFPTEDGYLMLTIARNIAIGNGMSTAAGTIPTNGTQPAVAFLWAACYWLVGGDKTLGVALVLIVEIFLSAMAAFVIYHLGKTLLRGYTRGKAMAALAAATWFVSPLSVVHTLNCLETGAYTLIVLVVVLCFVTSTENSAETWSLPRCIGLGLLLGLAFWVRNDAVVLVLAVCLTRVLSGLRHGRKVLVRRAAETVLMGATSVCVAMPWLVYNQLNFGNIMPISGISEAAGVSFGENFLKVLPALCEYVLMILPIPHTMELHPAVIAVCVGLLTAAAVVFVYVWRHAEGGTKTMMCILGIYGLGLCTFYGLFFGAGHFMSRYLFPLSPFFALLWAATTLALWDWLQDGKLRLLAPVGPVIVVMLVVGLNVRIYINGKNHMHFQVVEWVAEHVPEDAWVGAPQTGTLGYFHDRTINLDGKVNPEALKARLQREIPQYVLDKNIDYLADWVGLAGWADLPTLKPHFTLVVEDHQRNLAVLRRKPNTKHTRRDDPARSESI